MNIIHTGDALEILKTLQDDFVHCCVTSPPYWGLRDYGVDGQIGLEESPFVYIEKMCDVFREVRRVLRSDGTLWLNLGDTYATGAGKRGNSGRGAGIQWYARSANPKQSPNSMPIPGFKAKELMGIPWRVAFALQADGWYFRQDIVWHKPNPTPESMDDRCTKAHEPIFLMSKSRRYYFDQAAIREPISCNYSKTGVGFGHGYMGTSKRRYSVCNAPNNDGMRNKRTVWTVPTYGYRDAHFATFPPKLIEPCILAGCPEGGIVLDPFFGSGTVGVVALQHNCKYIGIELNPEYVQMAEKRIQREGHRIPSETPGFVQRSLFFDAIDREKEVGREAVE